MSEEMIHYEPGSVPADREAVPAFHRWWFDLLKKHPGLGAMQDHHRMKMISFADFRDAQRDAFMAGRRSGMQESAEAKPL